MFQQAALLQSDGENRSRRLSRSAPTETTNVGPVRMLSTMGLILTPGLRLMLYKMLSHGSTDSCSIFHSHCATGACLATPQTPCDMLSACDITSKCPPNTSFLSSTELCSLKERPQNTTRLLKKPVSSTRKPSLQRSSRGNGIRPISRASGLYLITGWLLESSLSST